MVIDRATGEVVCAFDSLFGAEEHIYNNDFKILDWEPLELYEDE